MKKRFTILLLFFACTAHATNYYFSSSSGSDFSNGLSSGTSWQSLAKMNSFFPSLQPGDSLLLKRGDTWYGTLTIGKSGLTGNRIAIGAYGTGARPVITGFTTISSWTNEGNGIYSTPLTAPGLTNMVTWSGAQVAMGRTPDNTYLTYQSAATNKSITSTALSGNWTGAEVVIRKTAWILNRNTVTSQTGQTLNYTSLGDTINAIPGFGFFLQNSLATLSVPGEWYHDVANSKFYMYFGGTPSGTVKVATVNNVVVNTGQYDNIIWDNVDLNGSINNLVNFTYNTSYWTFQNYNFSFAGNYGITLLDFCSNDTLKNGSVSWCNKAGIFDSPATGLVITGNSITNCGMKEGQVLGSGGYEAIFTGGNGVNITRNTILKTGYNGITLKYLGASLIQYNVIDSTVQLLDDGGGIYTSKINAATRIIDHNIVSNVLGNLLGTSNTKSPSAGIYLDEFASNCQVTHNSISNITNGAAVKNHKGSSNRIDSNTTYNCLMGSYSEDEVGNNVRNLSMKGNIFFAKLGAQLCLQWYTISNDVALFGTASNNVYSRPIDDNKTFKIQPKGNNTPITQTLAEWQAYTGLDTGSKRSPKVITNVNELLFVSNPTDTLQLINFLGFKKIDPNGVVYSNQATVERYDSKILMDSGAIANARPIASISPIAAITSPANQVTLTSTSTDADGPINSYKWTIVTGDGSITSPTLISSNMNSLSVGQHQVKLVVTDNLGAKDSAIVTFTVKPAIQPNKPPTISVGPDTTIMLPLNNLTVTMNAADSDGTVVKTKWFKISGPVSGTITNDTAATTTITSLTEGVYFFGAYAIDNSGDTTKTTKKVTVLAAHVNILPVADAGADTTIVLPINVVTLRGKATDADGNIFSYEWKEGATVLGSTASITLTGLTQGTHTYTLTVTDNDGGTNSKNVKVTVNAAPLPPSGPVYIIDVRVGN